MSSGIKTITLKITNMTCVNCENHIERALTGKEGILKVKASYNAGTAKVTYDSQKISPDKIVEILNKEDYYIRKETSGPKNAETTNKGSENTGPKDNQYDLTDLTGIAIIILAVYVIGNHLGLFTIFNTFPVAKDGMGYGMLFVIGLLTSVHCLAMCGGICLTQCALQKEGATGNKFTALSPGFYYNLGRVISYTVIGALVGALGSVVSFSGHLKGLVQVIAGIFMVIMGLNMLNILPGLRRLAPRMPKIFAKKIYAGHKSKSPLYIGLLNGLMPCGPLQAMQLYALSTGSPIKGAISMFLFSIGTVPLMFAFGALSSFLSKKFTGKMMSAGAVLVVVLGIFMFNSGLSLSGFSLPSLPMSTRAEDKVNVAVMEDGLQIVRSGITSGSFEAITVQKGIPVRWILEAEQGEINGCNNAIIIPRYSIRKALKVGENVIEFTPTESGTIPFSCWMGMIRSKINVVEEID